KKILKYRKHLMSTSTFVEIDSKRTLLKSAFASKKFHETDEIISKLEPLLRENGGDIYPYRAINDNVEVILVASIIAIAIRAFFLQTFQIPTNSMHPTYHGVTTTLREQATPASRTMKICNKLFNGTSSFDIVAEHTGSIEIPLFANSNFNHDAAGIVQFELHKVRKFFGLIPAQERVYSIKIGRETQKIHLPYAYSIDSAFLKKFGLGATSWQKLYDEHPEKFRVTPDAIFFKPGYSVKADDNLVNFDVVCGDMLFVNKLAYHFRRPKIGEAIVFRTEQIKNIPGNPHYFIKRLVGKSGDEIQLRNDTLLRNYQPIRGSEIFDKEVNKVDGYPGYTAVGSLKDRNIVKVPQKKYFVLGDNSPDSGDSRFWGFVPQTEVTGTPLFIFYPINRAGFCK
ncbi:MAG: signal peptidase I, partial [Opitutales bacterium]|nr:signal peptidase I [Opitutales bacterium]